MVDSGTSRPHRLGLNYVETHGLGSNWSQLVPIGPKSQQIETGGDMEATAWRIGAGEIERLRRFVTSGEVDKFEAEKLAHTVLGRPIKVLGEIATKDEFIRLERELMRASEATRKARVPHAVVCNCAERCAPARAAGWGADAVPWDWREFLVPDKTGTIQADLGGETTPTVKPEILAGQAMEAYRGTPEVEQKTATASPPEPVTAPPTTDPAPKKRRSRKTTDAADAEATIAQRELANAKLDHELRKVEIAGLDKYVAEDAEREAGEARQRYLEAIGVESASKAGWIVSKIVEAQDKLDAVRATQAAEVKRAQRLLEQREGFFLARLQEWALAQPRADNERSIRFPEAGARLQIDEVFPGIEIDDEQVLLDWVLDEIGLMEARDLGLVRVKYELRMTANGQGEVGMREWLARHFADIGEVPPGTHFRSEITEKARIVRLPRKEG